MPKKLNKDLSEPARESQCSNGAGLSPSEVAQCNAFIQRLFDAATEGDLNSFSQLVTIGDWAVELISTLVKERFREAQQIARKRVTGSYSISLFGPLSKEDREVVKHLELGKQIAIPVDVQKASNNTTEARDISTCLISLTDLLRRYNGLSISKSEIERDKKLLAVLPHPRNEVELARWAQIELDLSCLAHDIRADIMDNRVLGDILGIACELTDVEVDGYGEIAAKLPPLSKSTADAWFLFGRSVLMHWTNGKPERNPVLANLGQYRRDAYLRKSGLNLSEIEKRRASGKSKATEASNVRDGLFARIKSSYNLLVISN